MTTKPTDREYEDYEPVFEWEIEKEMDTLSMLLPRYKKERLKVEITSSGELMVSGKRHLGENKWHRFSKKFTPPPDFNTKEITACFDKEVLSVKVPKSPDETKKPTQETPKPQMPPSNQPQLQKNGYQEKAAEKIPSKTRYEKQHRNEPSDVNKKSSYMDEIGVDKQKSRATDSSRNSEEKKLKEEKNAEGKTDRLAANVDKIADKRKEITTAAMNNSAIYKRLTNLIMAVIFLLLIGFYAKNTTFKSKLWS